MKRTSFAMFVTLLVNVLLGCEGKKPGDRCDEFFQNTCKAPMSCVDMGEKKVCAGSCTMDPKNISGPRICTEPGLSPHEVTYTKGTTSLGSAGCYCLPK